MSIELSDNDQNEQLVKIFKALSDPTRIEMIRLLKHKGAAINCGEIGENFKLSLSTNSHHFRVLREAGLITTRKEGRHIYMVLHDATFQQYLPGFLSTL